MPAHTRYGPQEAGRRTVLSTILPLLPLTHVLAAIVLRLTLSSLLALALPRCTGRLGTSSLRPRQRSNSPTTTEGMAATITCKPQAPTRARGQMARISERTWMRLTRLLLARSKRPWRRSRQGPDSNLGRGVLLCGHFAPPGIFFFAGNNLCAIQLSSVQAF